MKEQDDAPNDTGIDYSEGSFIIKLPDCGYLNINNEILPGGMPSERFHVFYVTPEHGSSTFYVHMGDNAIWAGEKLPPFVGQDVIDQIGEAIERRDA